MTKRHSESPPARQRRSLQAAYRQRGKRNNNLWLIYSVKTDRDWLLSSDRQLIHWLYYLEINPCIKTFDLSPQPIISTDANETKDSAFDAMAEYTDGHIEWHTVKAGESHDASSISQSQSQAAKAPERGVQYVVFDDSHLRPHVKLAMRWLKPLAFAAVLRGQEKIPCRQAVISACSAQAKGTIGQLLADLCAYDEAIVLGMLVRLTIEAHLALDLDRESFGLTTEWRWHGKA
jgi:hypothetical protein